MFDLKDVLKLSKDGKYIVPDMSGKGMLPYVLSFDTHGGTLPVTVPAFPGQLTTGFIGPNLTDADTGMIVRHVTYSSPSTGEPFQCTVQLRDSNNRLYMNNPIHIKTWAGLMVGGTLQQQRGITPAFMFEPLVLESAHKVQLLIAGLDNAQETMRAYLHGAVAATKPGPQYAWITKFYRDMQARANGYVYPYYITTNTVPVLTSGQTNAQFDVKLGENVELFSAMAISDGDFEFSVTEARTGETLMNGKIAAAAGLGNANFPTIFKTPYRLPDGARLRFSFSDLSGSSNTIYFTLQGRKILVPFSKFNVYDREFMNAYPVPSLTREPVGVYE